MAIEKMMEWVNETLVSARKCFSREASFRWFVVIVIGFMVWQERIGVTSFIRELWIEPRHYESMLHFFRSKAWHLTVLREWWSQIVLSSGVIYYEFNMPILIGGGTKKAKFGRKMPCVKRLVQESGNASKHYIFGHMFGAIGFLAGDVEKLFCLPLSVRIHDGDKQIKQWSKESVTNESHVVRLIREASQAAKMLKKKSILLLDRYYLSVPALLAWIEEEKQAGLPLLSIVVRVKLNATAYTKAVPNPRGRPRKKGTSVKLVQLTELFANKFIKTSILMYGKETEISYYSIDLLWGKKLYQELRFVIVCGLGKDPLILASTDLSLSPVSIIRLYSYRFKIECSFRELKHTIAGFAYRFWSIATPKLNRFAKSKVDPLESVKDENSKKLISSAFDATHGFIMLGCIAHGLLQICSLRFADTINSAPLRWLRTVTNSVPSESSTADFFRKSLFRRFPSTLTILLIIQRFQNSSPGSLGFDASRRS